MAIRPVDLQLAYLAAPQSAAQANSAQQAPQAAQAAAQAAFINEVNKREETIAETDKAKGNVIRADAEGQDRGGYGQQQQRRRRQPEEAETDDSPFGLGGDDGHFIDFTA